MDAGKPFYTGDDDNQDTGGGIIYGLGFYLLLLLLIITLCYTSYICKRNISSRSPTIDNDDDDDDYHFVRLSHGLDDDILATFPTFPYSDTLNLHHNSHGSGCSVCLADYRPPDVLRLLPECGHFFHVSCIDTWLKVHPTCPVCRNLLDLTD